VSRVSTRLLVCFLCYVALLAGIVGATVLVLNRQHDDGLVVNLSGRQRMLTQRMTHQLLTFSSRLDGQADVADARQRVRTTMNVFETTLMALIEGGPAPTDLQLTAFRDVPPVSSSVVRRLNRVRQVYQRYREGAEAILEGSSTARKAGLESIISLESQLLTDMDSAVSLLQREAEKKVTDLFMIQGAALALSLMLTAALMRWARASVVQPLEQLRAAAEELSLGNLHRAMPNEGSPELRSLSESLERMRTSVRALLETRRRSDPVSMDMADW
jgi:nitrate/nitrite-specific signal transduction histidine kinase